MLPILESMLNDPNAADLVVFPKQELLTRTWMDSYIEPITQRIEQMRLAMDRGYGERVRAAQAHEKANPGHHARFAHYPKHCSEEIRDGVLTRMWADPFFQELMEKGLSLRPVFVHYKKRYLHDAIQLGNYFIDPVNDAERYKKLEIGWARVKEVRFENIDSWEDLAKVAESSLKVRVFPNVYLPDLFPALPLLAIYPDGRLDWLPGQHNVLVKDLREAMPRTGKLLDQAKRMEPRLPEAYRAKLETVFPEVYEALDDADVLQRKVAHYARLDAPERERMVAAMLRVRARLAEADFRGE